MSGFAKELEAMVQAEFEKGKKLIVFDMVYEEERKKLEIEKEE